LRNNNEIKLFWKNVSVVFSGTVIAQIIPIIGTIVIARIFTPASFGIFSVWFGIVIIGSIVITGRFELALAMEKDGEPRNIGVLTILIIIITGFVIFTLASFIGLRLNLFTTTNSNLVMLFPVTSLLLALNATWQNWASAEGKYKELSYIRIFHSFSTLFSQIIIGIFYPKAISLALGVVIGSLFSQLFSIFKIPLQIKTHSPKIIFQNIKLFIRKHKKFFFFSLPGDSINATVAQLPLLIISARFGAEISGFLALTIRALGAPIGLMGKSILDVFRRQATQAYQKYNTCRIEYMHTFKVLLVLSVSSMAVFYFFSEQIFILVFGKEWKLSGTIAIWLLPLFALRFIASPLSYMFYLAKKQNWDLVWQISLLVVSYIALTTPINYSNSLQLYSAGYTGLYIIYLMLSFRLTEKKADIILKQ